MLISNKRLITLCLSFGLTPLLAYQPENKPNNQWSIVKKPTKGISESVGSYANGCLSGGKALPASGKGYIDMRRNRNRYYGHPRLIQFIQSLGKHTMDKYQQKHLIGDLSQPRGGRMNFGHSSHQVGLDVDIWMQTIPASQSVNPYRDMLSIVDKSQGIMLNGILRKPLRDALYFSATYPTVARIFVNPIVKVKLCQTEKNRQWLRKLRPWWGHDEHFHVRLTCPPNSLNCKDQKPVPEGDGCDDSLYDWVAEQSDRANRVFITKKNNKVKVRRNPIPPDDCEFIRLSTD